MIDFDFNFDIKLNEILDSLIKEFEKSEFLKKKPCKDCELLLKMIEENQSE